MTTPKAEGFAGSCRRAGCFSLFFFFIMKKVLSPFALFLLLFLPLPRAWAQVDLVVSVLDNARKPVAGLPVHLDNAAIGFSAELPTNAQGQARFRGLSTAGSYAVSTTVSEQVPGRARSGPDAARQLQPQRDAGTAHK